MSKPTCLHLSAPARIPRTGPSHTVIPLLLNQSRSLDCDAQGVPPPNITWSRDGERLVSFLSSPEGGAGSMELGGGVDVIEGGRRLRLAGVEAEDSGAVYRCKVENSWGEDEVEYTINVLGLIYY